MADNTDKISNNQENINLQNTSHVPNQSLSSLNNQNSQNEDNSKSNIQQLSSNDLSNELNLNAKF